MVGISYVHMDTIFMFYEYTDFFFFIQIFTIWMFECDQTYAVLGIFYACVSYFFVFVLVQRNWACFTGKDALEIQIWFWLLLWCTGKMTAEVKSPSGLIPVTVDDSVVGRSTVLFTPREEGLLCVCVCMCLCV